MTKQIISALVLLTTMQAMWSYANDTEANQSSAAPMPTPTTVEEPQIRGLLKPLHEATLSSEILATITEMPFTEGKRFKKGDALVRFDCKRYKAELAAAGAEHEAKQKVSENNAELATYNAAATLQVEVSAAETAKAAAQNDVAKTMVNGCVISAPWDGRVEEAIAHTHETVSPGKELIRILDDSNLEISILVPSKWLPSLKVGTTFDFLVDEVGKKFPAKITELGARVDPVSQTIRLSGSLLKPEASLLAGMSGSAHFKFKKAK
jgi:RND family efflux transporter MFP subunit